MIAAFSVDNLVNDWVSVILTNDEMTHTVMKWLHIWFCIRLVYWKFMFWICSPTQHSKFSKRRTKVLFCVLYYQPTPDTLCKVRTGFSQRKKVTNKCVLNTYIWHPSYDLPHANYNSGSNIRNLATPHIKMWCFAGLDTRFYTKYIFQCSTTIWNIATLHVKTWCLADLATRYCTKYTIH